MALSSRARQQDTMTFHSKVRIEPPVSQHRLLLEVLPAYSGGLRSR